MDDFSLNNNFVYVTFFKGFRVWSGSERGWLGSQILVLLLLLSLITWARSLGLLCLLICKL